MKRFLFTLVLIFWGTSSALAANPLFRYGFLGGDFFPNEDAAVSSWNDIHYACHFLDAISLQNAINQVSSPNKIQVELSAVFQNRTPSCDLDGPWGNASLFSSRIALLVSTLNANKSRLWAIFLFDEPDISHGGPSNATLQSAVDYLHVNVPGVPVFVNWYTASNNTRVPNADWYSTTRGANPSSLSGLGKPMLLWWFNNDANPSEDTVNNRWTGMLDYWYRTTSPTVPPIMSLGWCCDSIENYNGPNNNNSILLDALLAHIGYMRHAQGGIVRPGYINFSGDWFLFRLNLATRQLEYTRKNLWPTYLPFPIGTPGGSAFSWPAVTLEGSNIRIAVGANGTNFYEAFVTTSGSWTGWSLLGSGKGRPDLFRFNSATWLGVQASDNTIWVQRRGIDSWMNLGGVAAWYPIFKVVGGNLRVAVFGTDNKVYSRQWNGSSWSNWAIEP